MCEEPGGAFASFNFQAKLSCFHSPEPKMTKAFFLVSKKTLENFPIGSFYVFIQNQPDKIFIAQNVQFLKNKELIAQFRFRRIANTRSYSLKIQLKSEMNCNVVSLEIFCNVLTRKFDKNPETFIENFPFPLFRWKIKWKAEFSGRHRKRFRFVHSFLSSRNENYTSFIFNAVAFMTRYPLRSVHVKNQIKIVNKKICSKDKIS